MIYPNLNVLIEFIKRFKSEAGETFLLNMYAVVDFLYGWRTGENKKSAESKLEAESK